MTHSEAVQSSAAERYLLDEMSEVERHAFEEHYFECFECADDVQAGAVMREGAAAGLLNRSNVRAFEAKPQTSTRATPSWRPSILLPWAAAATFAIVAGYQTLQQSSTFAPQALAPVTLRPDSRGAEPVVTLPANGSAVTLAIEVNSADELAYDLRSSQGQSVASGRAPAPPAGAPLLLLIPVWTLSPDEHYILSVRRGTDGPLVDEYRFAVAGR
jgi:anti-sigma factor RsiW